MSKKLKKIGVVYGWYMLISYFLYGVASNMLDVGIAAKENMDASREGKNPPNKYQWIGIIAVLKVKRFVEILKDVYKF